MRTIFVIAGPTNAGKTTVMNKLLEDDSLNLAHAVTTNSRAIRPTEVDGLDYHFVSKQKFEEMIANGEFIEWALVHTEYKGMQKRSLDSVPTDKNILIQLDIQGFHTFKRVLPSDEYKIVGIFIEPPSIEELKRRLIARGVDTNADDIRTRIEVSYPAEMADRFSFDHIVLNEDLDKCIEEVRGIIKATQS